MKYAWLVWLPLLFLPETFAQQRSQFGNLTIADFLISPYIFLVWWASKRLELTRQPLPDRVFVLGVIFIFWAFFSTLLIPVRFEHSSNEQLIFSLLKIGKFALYSLAGFLTARLLVDQAIRRWFDRSLTVATSFVGASLLLSLGSNRGILGVDSWSQDPYKSNPVGALLAILLCYLAGRLLSDSATMKWRLVAAFGLVVATAGLLLNPGRGGWLAAAAGLLYLTYRLGLRRSLLVGIVAISVAAYTYLEYPQFQNEIDRTIRPDESYLRLYGGNAAGLDDGARPKYWVHEGKKLLTNPLLGRGFFNRGAASGLDPDGSHNFFIQMFLETGVVGGLLILSVFFSMWRQANSSCGGDTSGDAAFRAAWVAAVVAAMGGEYFYGGMALFALVALYGATGSRVIEQRPLIGYRRHSRLGKSWGTR